MSEGEQHAQMIADNVKADHSFSMDFHFRRNTPMKIKTSGGSTWLQIGTFPAQLTMFITPKFAEDLMFVLGEYLIVEKTR